MLPFSFFNTVMCVDFLFFYPNDLYHFIKLFLFIIMIKKKVYLNKGFVALFK